MAVKRAGKAAIAVSTSVVENGYSSNDMLAVDMDEKDEGSSSAKATLSWSSAETEDENDV